MHRRESGGLARAIAATLCGALCLTFFFRGQLGDGFTLLLGDRHDGVIALSILEHWYNVLRGLEPWDRTAYFFPVPATLGYNDGYLLFGLIHAGFRALGADPFLSGELVNIATRAIGFAATLALCRRVLGLAPVTRRSAAFFAAADEAAGYGDAQDVPDWLARRGFGALCPLFDAHLVDWETLPLLTGEDLRDIGVADSAQRLELLIHITREYNARAAAEVAAELDAASEGEGERLAGVNDGQGALSEDGQDP
jgi:hypothetical protein